MGREESLLAFLPVVEEEFLVADLLRYTEGFSEPFFIGPVSECDWEVVQSRPPLSSVPLTWQWPGTQTGISCFKKRFTLFCRKVLWN
jgi:hypothetical protein